MGVVALTTVEVLEYLSTPKGRERLALYGSTLSGHTALAGHMGGMPNTIAASLLSEVLREAAVRAVLEDPDVLSESGRRLSVQPIEAGEAKPRPNPRVLEEPETREEIRRVLMEVGRLSARAVNTCFDDTLTNFQVAVVNVLTGQASSWNTTKFFNAWDSFDALLYGRNEASVKARRDASMEVLTRSFMGTIHVRPAFIERARILWPDWEDFLETGSGTAGTLARLAQGSLTTPDLWDSIEARAKSDMRDRLMVAAAHPSIPKREEALMVLEATRLIDLPKTDLYSLAEVLALLPIRSQKSLGDGLQILVDSSWSAQEIATWNAHLSSWGATPWGPKRKKSWFRD